MYMGDVSFVPYSFLIIDTPIQAYYFLAIRDICKYIYFSAILQHLCTYTYRSVQRRGNRVSSANHRYATAISLDRGN